MTPPPRIPIFPPSAGPGDFLRGLQLPFGALAVIGRSKALKKLTALASVVTLFALTAVVVLAARCSDDAVAYFWARPESWYGLAAWYLVVALSFVALTVIGATVVPTLLLSPLQDPISEATEEYCGGFEAPAFSLAATVRGFTVGLAHTLGHLALFLVVHGFILGVNLIPGIGTALWPILASLWTMLWSASEFLAAPVARHTMPYALVRRVIGARLGLCLGFGAAVYLLLWIPILNLFFIPLAVVGGTLLFRGLQLTGDLPASQPAPSPPAT